MKTPGNVECLFRSKDGRPQFWIKHTRGKTLVYNDGIPVPVNDFSDIVRELKKYLGQRTMPWYDSALYSMVLKGKLPGKFKPEPAVIFMGMPAKIEIIMFQDFSMFDGKEHYESVNELCIELKYNQGFRKQVKSLAVISILEDGMEQFTKQIVDAVRTLRPAAISIPGLS